MCRRRGAVASESPLIVDENCTVEFNVMVPVAEPLVAVLSPVNTAFGAAPAAVGSKFRMTPAEFAAPPRMNGPWMWPSEIVDVRPENWTL